MQELFQDRGRCWGMVIVWFLGVERVQRQEQGVEIAGMSCDVPQTEE